MTLVVQTLVKFVFLVVVAGIGLVLGKKYREHKDSQNK